MGAELFELLPLLPTKYGTAMKENRLMEHADRIVDIVMDLGRQPFLYQTEGTRRLVFNDSTNVSQDDLDHVVDAVEKDRTQSSTSAGNRAGIDGQLHRISFLRNRNQEVIGVTIRIGRAVHGIAEVLEDVKHSSVLFLGPPGSGKTTILRDFTRMVSEERHTCIVDTSNEIGGEGDVPHASIGNARRMMVPSLKSQADVMVECLQNHTIRTMVIDEIGRKAEVHAANTIKNRGVQLVASAHGSFEELIRNKELNSLLGNVMAVTLSDRMSKKQAMGKLQRRRIEPPVFDTIVELSVPRKGVSRHDQFASFEIFQMPSTGNCNPKPTSMKAANCL